ncbi:MAG: ferric iron uptake transcriptional regulator [Candidatus Contendobacter odensis]|uniref:Ferric uptake regulation protein n=1 Tax=Candidatus Contendibacter odensensis TaxID=1400860 RepID=A0A2G6PEW8_9GAMM|nr:MAG: ferric iron uptake transcriptional regulator [Candidatus Contendobacter odensis]
MGSRELKQVGLKVTLPRIKILDMLQSKDCSHLTAEEIYRALLDAGEEVGLATVYRVLTQFESVGLVKRHHFESGQSVFELNQGKHHDHILCLKCGRIEEFYDDEIEQRQYAIAQKLGFELTKHSLILYGHCKRPDCVYDLSPEHDA